MTTLTATGRPSARTHAVLCAIGLALSLLLWRMQGPAAVELAASMCGDGPRVNCTEVLSSSWSKVRGIPVSALGAIYFALLLGWFAVIGMPNRAGRAWHGVPTLVVLSGALFSLQLIRVMALQLGVWCPWCVAAHAVNLILAAATLWSWRRIGRAEARVAVARRVESGAADQPADAASGGAVGSFAFAAREAHDAVAYPSAGRASAYLLLCASLLAAAVAGVMALAYQVQATAWRAEWLKSVNNVEYAMWRWSISPRVNIPIRPDDPTRGAADAKHTAVVFSDFQCPQCRTLDKLLADLAEASDGRLRIVFKHFPLCIDCNPRLRPQQGCAHRRACGAAEAAEAVREIAGAAAAVQFGERLFQSSDLSDAALVRLAAAAGIDSGEFSEARGRPHIRRRIDEDIALAATLGIRGSGTLYVDGRQLAVWRLVLPQDPMQTDDVETRRLWERLMQ